MQEVFQMPGYMFNSWYKASEAGVNMNPITNEYTVRGKWRNSLTENTYGTHRKNALTILEESLNLRDSKVYDYFEEDGGL